ncbi:MAG: hypothetical protein KHZ72_09285 [Lachnospiraceae bacterium]|nr:hypothetical protein [Lachnospiraceae bacterium]
MEGSRKKEKWNRLLDAFSQKGTPYAVPQYPQVEPEQMAEELSEISETVWGMYAFGREPLEGKFTREQKYRYIAEANACGREWADRVAKEYGTNDPGLLAERMGMKVLKKKTPTGGGIVLFAQFVQPDEITIFTDCIAKAQHIYRACGCPLLESEKLTSVLLAHELFHAVEERHEKEIYTRTEKVELWRRPFSNRSSIVCLSEIAAMAFAAQMTGIEVSPYMLDVLLVYAYDQNAAWGLYEEVCSLRAEEQKLQEKRENKNTCLD